MSITVESGATMKLEEFWRWLMNHPNCILRAGSVDAVLYDLEEFHWLIDYDPEHRPWMQLIRGKSLVGEIIIEPRDVLYVQASPDEESGDKGDKGYVLFEIIGGPKGEAYPLYHVLMSHGIEPEPPHARTLKH